MPLLRPARPGLSLLLASLPLCLSACASAQVEPGDGLGAETAALVDHLPLSEQVLREAPGRPLALAPPPGIEAERLRPHSAEDARARLGLDEALTVLSPTNVFPPVRSVIPPTDQVLRDTTRLYLEAREMAIDGRYFDSIRTLEQALKLDPGSVACMRLMAENYLSTTGPAQALRLYENILAIEPEDVDALWRLGSAAWQRRDVARAAAMLGRAHRLLSAPERRAADRDVWCLTAHGLGQVLLAEGCDEAGVAVWHELMQRLLAPPPPSPRYQRDIDRLYRAAPDMWRDLGDAFSRLERFDDAVEAYALAADVAPRDDQAVIARLVWALARSGRNDTAMNLLLAQVDDPRIGHAGGLLALFRGTPLGDRLIAALRARLERRPAELTYVKALAALLDPERSDAIILDYLAEHGADLEVARDLLPWTIERLAPAQSVRLILGVARSTGRVPDELLDELVARTDDPDRFLAAWSDLPEDSRSEPVAELVRAGLLMRAFRWEEAAAALDALIEVRPGRVEPRLRRASLLLALNEVDAATDLLDRTQPAESDPIDAVYDKAVLLAQVGRTDEALSLLDRLAAGRGDDVDLVEHLRRRAGLLVSVGRHEEAAAELDRAIEIDPANDAVYAALLRLYGFTGPLRDTDRFGGIIRAIMTHAPQGRTARLLRAEQDALRGRFDDAIAGFQSLIEDDDPDGAALEGLVKTWLAAGRAGEAVTWLAERRAVRPGDRRLRDAWLKALVADHRGSEAVEFLERAVASRPFDVDSSRRLEEVLKSLGREEEAREVMRRRWTRMPPSVARSLALVELEVQAQQGAEALSHLREALRLADEHLDRHLDSIMLMATRVASAGPRPEAMELIREAGERLIARGLKAPTTAFLAYITALAELNRPLDEILAAIEGVAAVDPSIEHEMFAVATVALARQERVDDACALADRWLSDERPLEAREAGLVEWRLVQSVVRNEPLRAVNLTTRAYAGEAHRSMRLFSERLPGARGEGNSLADSLYLLSGEFSARGFDDSHEILLLEALKADPDHASANNDFGYLLADRGERLADAEAMLVKAVRADPSNSAYLDSLGWVRYKLGRLENMGDEVHEQGAVALLEEAALLRRGDATRTLDDDPVILDHLGDAYWRAGRKEDAVAAWQRAFRAYDEQLKATAEVVEEALPLEVFKEYYGPVADAARAKAEAAAAGGAPAVAPAPGLDEADR